MRKYIISLFCLLLILSGTSFVVAAETNSNQDSITVGINVPLSGAYKNMGVDQRRAYKLAVEQINANGGLLGKQMDYVVKDTEVDPQVAEQNAIEFIQEEQVDMVTGGASSAVAIAQSDVCQENGVVFMAALTHSSATTGFDKTKTGYKTQKAHRHTFRWYINDWMTKEALVPFMVEQFGEDARYFHITADYIWGYTLEESIKDGTGLHGSQTLNTVKTPLGTTDFSQPMQQAKESGADVLVLNLFGQDLVSALEQVNQMQLNESLHIVAPIMEINIAHTISNEVLQDTYSTLNWYHGLHDRFNGSKEFVQAFSQEHGRPPGASAASAWVALKEWAAAVVRAGTTKANEVIRELEGHTFNLLKDSEKWRSWDHQAISSIYIVQGKSPQEMAGEWDVLQILESIPGREVMRSRNQNPVMLEQLQ